MTIRRDGHVLHLEGDCPVEEAEGLSALLSSGGAWSVDLAQCRHLHSAVVQTLLRFKPEIRGGANANSLHALLGPALISAIDNAT